MKNYNQMTVADVSLSLGISRSAVYSIIHRGELGYSRYGRCIRVNANDLRAFMMKNSFPEVITNDA